MTREEVEPLTILEHVIDGRGVLRIIEQQPDVLTFDLDDDLGCGFGLEIADVKIMAAALNAYLNVHGRDTP